MLNKGSTFQYHFAEPGLEQSQIFRNPFTPGRWLQKSGSVKNTGSKGGRKRATFIISKYGIPSSSAMINPPAPMTGGKTYHQWMLDGSMAPATSGLKPAFSSEIVNVPVDTVLAMALPEIEPKNADAMTDTLPGPPGR